MHRDAREGWHNKSIAALTAQLGTDVQQGLTPPEAAQRLQQWGHNELRTGPAITRLALLAGQFRRLVNFFAFKAGMLDTPIAALGGWPTVSARF